MYCLWLTVAKEDDNFVIQTTKPLPEFKNLSEQEQIRFIRERILGKSNEQLVQVSDFILLELSILLFMMNIMRMMILVSVVTGTTNFQGDYEDDDNRTLIKSQGPVSRNCQNFSGSFWVTLSSLYLQNKGVSKPATLQLFQFLFPLQHIKRQALQNKRVAIGFRARKVLGTFKKRAPGYLPLVRKAAWIGQSANATHRFHQIERASYDQTKLFILEESSMGVGGEEGGGGVFRGPVSRTSFDNFTYHKQNKNIS